MKDTVLRVVRDLYDVDADVLLTRPDPKFGDYATNIALQLAKKLCKNPRDIAEEIAGEMRQIGDFAEVSIAGQGFINIRLSDSSLLNYALREPAAVHKDINFVIEYSCPNAFKELHTGHLYQTIFGDILARLIENSGATVHRTSFGGDVGLHVAKCLWGMIDILGGELPDKLADISDDVFERARWISKCYVRGAGIYEENESAKSTIDQLNKTIYGLHEKNEDTLLSKMYWTTRQWSFDYFEAFYNLIQVDQMRYYPESQTAPVGMKVVEKQLSLGNLKHSEGAVVFEGDESKHLHTRVFVTRMGLPTYETKDIGVIWKEKADYNFDKRILLTGNDQREYMRVVFAAAETFRPELAGTMTHLTNGTVRFADGKKMSSRLGNVSRAADVIEIVREKVRELTDNEQLVEAMTLGAIKYVFAKYKLGGDIAFDVDETVTLQGNSGPYLQYAHARACSVLEKSNVKPQTEISELDENERMLARKLGEYSEIIELSAREFTTHHICNYLYELAQEFNRFYEKSRVIGDDREAIRIRLVQIYRDKLASGLEILGIVAPEKI